MLLNLYRPFWEIVRDDQTDLLAVLYRLLLNSMRPASEVGKVIDVPEVFDPPGFFKTVLPRQPVFKDAVYSA